MGLGHRTKQTNTPGLALKPGGELLSLPVTHRPSPIAGSRAKAGPPRQQGLEFLKESALFSTFRVLGPRAQELTEVWGKKKPRRRVLGAWGEKKGLGAWGETERPPPAVPCGSENPGHQARPPPAPHPLRPHFLHPISDTWQGCWRVTLGASRGWEADTGPSSSWS